MIDYLDIQRIVGNGLHISEEYEPCQDPVERSIFLFHLETQWKDKWNSLQGFEGWWSPHFFEPQNNRPFDPKDFAFS